MHLFWTSLSTFYEIQATINSRPEGMPPVELVVKLAEEPPWFKEVAMMPPGKKKRLNQLVNYW